MNPENLDLRQFAEWATALRARYRSDLFFRTAINTIALQVGFVLVCIINFFVALHSAHPLTEILVVPLIAAVGSAMLLTRFALQPARNTLAQQKRFVSDIAHELRTPLSTIKTSTEVALLDETFPPPVRRVLSNILEEMGRISEIINNLLSLSTLTRPERMSFENVDLKPLINKVVRVHAGLARERDVKIIANKDPNHVVWGNATALEQIISNILKNALSYTPRGAQGTVTITVQPDYHGMILFSVADNGIGISQEDLFHITEPFYRADTSRVRRIRKAGSGLGLTIVHEIVRMHRGRIHIKSTKGKGTVVSVFLPIGSAQKEDEQSETLIDFSSGSKELSSASL